MFLTEVLLSFFLVLAVVALVLAGDWKSRVLISSKGSLFYLSDPVGVNGSPLMGTAMLHCLGEMEAILC